MEDFNEKSKVFNQAIYSAAVDIKVGALLSLLIDKGVVSEKEVIDYTQDMKNKFISTFDLNIPGAEKDISDLEKYLEGFK